MAFTLPPLPYDFGALEPSIDAKTMEIHHDKHHGGYVTNLNAALEKAPDFAGRSLDDILAHLDRVPESVRTAVRNNGGGHWNHTMFWEIMKPGGGGEPSGALAAAITHTFGSVAEFKTRFAAAAMARFGSGWAWLLRDGDSLTIASTPNQDNPVMEGRAAGDIVMGLDVWEHAYYLKYQNRRADYITAWWDVVSWEEIGRRFDAAKSRGGSGKQA